jgi:hypothetical protein
MSDYLVQFNFLSCLRLPPNSLEDAPESCYYPSLVIWIALCYLIGINAKGYDGDCSLFKRCFNSALVVFLFFRYLFAIPSVHISIQSLILSAS